MHIKRHLRHALARIEKMFGAVLVVGSRQVGKTTLLRSEKPALPYITLDDPIMHAAAVNEPATFFKAAPPPLVIDEIQYAPQLFSQIKIMVDSLGAKGLFFMSGSQQFQMMRNVGESLAGRIGILNLFGLSLREIRGDDFRLPFVPTPEYLHARGKTATGIALPEVWEMIHRGSLPAMYANADMDWQMYYAAYVKTYIERDVRALTQVGDEIAFLRFITAVAARTGQLLNQAAVARDAGVSQPTVERWLAILQASNIVRLLPPYHNNAVKRAIKTPKLYFLDTGLAAYLTRWNTPEVLRNGAMAGAFFETFVVAEILKSYANTGILEPPLFFYRDKEQNEIDLLVMEGSTLHPIEIKKHADPKPGDAAAFKTLDAIPGITRGSGCVLCLYEKAAPLGGNDMVVPVSWI